MAQSAIAAENEKQFWREAYGEDPPRSASSSPLPTAYEPSADTLAAEAFAEEFINDRWHRRQQQQNAGNTRRPVTAVSSTGPRGMQAGPGRAQPLPQLPQLPPTPPHLAMTRTATPARAPSQRLITPPNRYGYDI